MRKKKIKKNKRKKLRNVKDVCLLMISKTSFRRYQRTNFSIKELDMTVSMIYSKR